MYIRTSSRTHPNTVLHMRLESLNNALIGISIPRKKKIDSYTLLLLIKSQHVEVPLPTNSPQHASLRKLRNCSIKYGKTMQSL